MKTKNISKKKCKSALEEHEEQRVRIRDSSCNHTQERLFS
jgi:hypothetical protein